MVEDQGRGRRAKRERGRGGREFFRVALYYPLL